MKDIQEQIDMSRAKSTTLEGSEPGAANLLRMNANKMDELLAVAESAKILRDYCREHSGTPPNTFVCELDDDLTELEAEEMPEANPQGPCEHNDWYENTGWCFCRQCVRHWDASYVIEATRIVDTTKAIIGEWKQQFQGLCPPAETILTSKQTEELQQQQDEIIVALGSAGILPSEIVGEIKTLTNRNKDLEAACKAARDFIDQYGYVITSPAYKDVWKTLNDFNIGYMGPLFKDPITLRGALEKVELPLMAVKPSIEDKYFDLLLWVEKKVPGETRHETAKRLIQEGENRPLRTGSEKKA